MRHAISDTWRTEENKIVAAQQRDTKKVIPFLMKKKIRGEGGKTMLSCSNVYAVER